MSSNDSHYPEPSEQPDKRKAATRMAAKILRAFVACLLLYLIFSQIGAVEILRRAGSADLLILLPAVALFVLVNYIASVRLKHLMDAQGLTLTAPVVFEINLAARFYALFLPGGNLSALLIRVFRFAREGSQTERIVTALFADRIIATWSLCLIGILFWMPAQSDWLWLFAFVAAFFACLIPVAAIFLNTWSFVPGWFTDLMRRLAPNYWSRLSDAVRRSRRSGLQTMNRSIVISLLAHLIGTAGYWLLALSLGLDLSLMAIGWIRAGMMLATLVPVSISGLGVREAASLVLLSYYGVPADAAIAYSLIVFMTSILFIGLLGGLAEAWRFSRQ
jgi:uncharacterized protein (TIRG00374 family)